MTLVIQSDLSGMVKWPFQWRIATSNDRGSKGHGLNHLDFGVHLSGVFFFCVSLTFPFARYELANQRIHPSFLRKWALRYLGLNRRKGREFANVGWVNRFFFTAVLRTERSLNATHFGGIKRCKVPFDSTLSGLAIYIMIPVKANDWNPEVAKRNLSTWMSQEVSRWLAYLYMGYVGVNPLIPTIY